MSTTVSQSTTHAAVVQVRSDCLAETLKTLEARSCKVAVLGLGYVGLPLAVETARAGFDVVGIDLDPAKVAAVANGTSTTRDIPDASVAELTASGKLTASTDPALIAECRVAVIAVPTPLTKNLAPDLQYVCAAAEMIATYIQPGTLVSLESTTYPGTTADVLRPILDKSNLVLDLTYFLAHSPERVDPGNEKFQTKNTPKVVGGVGPNSLTVATTFYQQMIDTLVPVSSSDAAELVKVYENVFRAVNVGLVNELTRLCDRMGINVWEVLDAAYTKPFGIMPFYPGPGVGGHCIPLDPHYLEHKAREYAFNTRFISVAGEINRSMPAFVVEKAIRCLNAAEKSVKNSKILILGVAYKPNVEDFRESPAIHIIQMLHELGARVSYHDPLVPEFVEHNFKMVGVQYSIELVRDADLVILTTNHSAFDLREIVENAKSVLDTRNATKVLDIPKPNVTLL